MSDLPVERLLVDLFRTPVGHRLPMMRLAIADVRVSAPRRPAVACHQPARRRFSSLTGALGRHHQVACACAIGSLIHRRDDETISYGPMRCPAEPDAAFWVAALPFSSGEDREAADLAEGLTEDITASSRDSPPCRSWPGTRRGSSAAMRPTYARRASVPARSTCLAAGAEIGSGPPNRRAPRGRADWCAPLERDVQPHARVGGPVRRAGRGDGPAWPWWRIATACSSIDGTGAPRVPIEGLSTRQLVLWHFGGSLTVPHLKTTPSCGTNWNGAPARTRAMPMPGLRSRTSTAVNMRSDLTRCRIRSAEP